MTKLEQYELENINPNYDDSPSAPSDNVAADDNKKKRSRAQNVYYVYEDDQIVETTTNKAAARVRRFSMSSYIPLEDIERYLSSQKWIQHYAYAYHDKDKKSDGTPKEPHTHILLYTYDGKTSSAVCKIFNRYAKSICTPDDTPQQTLGEFMEDPVHMWRYLLHLDDPDKYQYEESRRHCDDFGYWKSMERTECLTESTSNNALQIIQDISNGVSQIEMVRRYGREWVINGNKYISCHQAILRETNGWIKTPIYNVDELLLLQIFKHLGLKGNERQIFLSVLDKVQTYAFRTWGYECDLQLISEKERIQQ